MNSESLEGVNLNPVECHFNWDLEKVGDWVFNPQKTMDRLIERYNRRPEQNMTSRFICSCLMAYIAYKHELGRWQNLMINAAKILEYSRDHNISPPILFFPSWTGNVNLWTEEWHEFQTKAPMIYLETVEESSDCEEEETFPFTFDEYDDQLKDVYWIAANHVFHGLSSSFELNGKIPPTASRVRLVENADKAAVLLFRAKTTRFVSPVEGLSKSISLIKQAVLLDKDNPLWVLNLITYINYKKHHIYNFSYGEDNVELIKTIDNALGLNLKPSMRVEFLTQKIRILLYSGGRCLSEAEEILRLTDSPISLAYCAEVLSNCGPDNFRRALAIMDDLIKKYPKITQILAKASNLYRKANNLPKALELAERASQVGYGSCWQVLTLKIALNHQFSYEDFFSDVMSRFNDELCRFKTLAGAFLFYASRTDQYGLGLTYFEQLGNWEEISAVDLSHFWCQWSKNYVNVVEAAYNVSLFTINNADSDDDCIIAERVRSTIEEKTALKELQVFPVRYMNRLKGRYQKTLGSRPAEWTEPIGERRSPNNDLRTSKNGIDWMQPVRENPRKGHINGRALCVDKESNGSRSNSIRFQRYDTSHLKYNWRERSSSENPRH